MDSAAEPPQGQGSWQKGSALQTIALDEHDLPSSAPEQQVCLLSERSEHLVRQTCFVYVVWFQPVHQTSIRGVSKGM